MSGFMLPPQDGEAGIHVKTRASSWGGQAQICINNPRESAGELIGNANACLL